MKLIFLGTTGYHPNELRHTASLMLPELGIILDAGTGMFRARDYLCTPQLDIFLTHTHLDHVIGLTFLFDILNGKQVDRVTVHALAAKIAAIETHLLADDLFPVKLPCNYSPFHGPVSIAQGGQLTYFPLHHPGGSLGFRLQWPTRSLAYVTDTTARPDADYIEHIREVDTLIHECYFPDAHADLAVQTGHSSITAVAELARAAQVRRLVLVHSNPLTKLLDPIGVETARAIFPATLLATDLLELEI